MSSARLLEGVRPAPRATRQPTARVSLQDGLLAGTSLLLFVCYVLPVAAVVILSVSLPSPGLHNYIALFGNTTVRTVVGNTVLISTITVSLTVLLAYGAAYALVQASPARRQVMLAGVLLPLWVSVLVRSYAWVAVLGSEGLVNTALRGAGWTGDPLPLVRNTLGVVIGMVHYMLPYAILPLFAQMSRIDRGTVAVARALGASPWQAFRHVFLPLSRPGVAAAVFLTGILSLGFYLTPAILGGGKTVMVAEFISVQIAETLRWDLATTLSTVLLLVSGALVWRYSHLLDLAVGAKA